MHSCRYIALLKDAFDANGSGRGLFFSFDADVTLTQQRFAAVAGDGPPGAKSLHARADPRFVWNKTHTKPLIGATYGPAAAAHLGTNCSYLTSLKFVACNLYISLWSVPMFE